MKTPTVFTWGYSKRWPIDLSEIVDNYDIGYIIDVRARPQSRRPDWGKRLLDDAFESRYVWAECFGNPEGLTPPEWMPYWSKINPDGAHLAAIIRSGMLGNVLLLCLEQDPVECHRSAVAEFIGLPTVHLGWPEVQG